MNTPNKPAEVADDVVVMMKYTLTVDGEEIDSADENDPIAFLQGSGEIIPGLEKALYGMKVGQSKKVTVAPAEGYGPHDPESMLSVPRSEFPDDIPLEVGLELDVRDEDDEVMSATIVAVTEDAIQLDFNHPLAGKTLHFDITVVDLRVATEEELEHGHVHDDDDEYEDEDEEE
ncbi:MAG TPA: peptidylprolyl isomerase [Anaerolineaceae bacterium]|nr:peptidylprolyl isomerase [Anaerolineaceae bacterium]